MAHPARLEDPSICAGNREIRTVLSFPGLRRTYGSPDLNIRARATERKAEKAVSPQENHW